MQHMHNVFGYLFIGVTISDFCNIFSELHLECVDLQIYHDFSYVYALFSFIRIFSCMSDDILVQKRKIIIINFNVLQF